MAISRLLCFDKYGTRHHADDNTIDSIVYLAEREGIQIGRVNHCRRGNFDVAAPADGRSPFNSLLGGSKEEVSTIVQTRRLDG
jgi:hypothetical protein